MGAPPPPPEAAELFGDRLPLATAYADRLAGEATVRGLIGPREVPRLWSRHLLNSALLSRLVPPEVTVIDVGSGAGLPGIPLAVARPDLQLVLVEPLLRRSGWLEELVASLGLDSVRVVRDRAEHLHGTLSAPVVTARAVAPLDRLARWCLPLVEPGGELLALKGESARTELAEARDELRRLGARSAEVVELGVGTAPDPTSVVRVRVGSSTRAAPGGGTAGRQTNRRKTRGGGR